MKVSYFGKAAGTTMDGRQDVIALMSPKTKLVLRREQNNKFDANAIAIDALLDGDWRCVGYIPKEKNENLAKELDKGTRVAIALKEITGGGDKNYGLNYSIEYENDISVELKRLIPDIGTGFVMFDEENHAYFDEDGNRMISGSVFEEEFSPIANFSYAAKAMGKSTGIKPDEILELWDENRDLSADYGTLIHKGLETYFKKHELMKRLDSHKKRIHTATTYMPQAVGDIVDKYIALNGAGFAERCSPEVFIRHEGRCGFVDLVEQDGKGLITHDYKFVKELKKVKYREYGEYNKYTLQQNFYRTLIEANGHEVHGMVLELFRDGVWGSVEVEKIELGI